MYKLLILVVLLSGCSNTPTFDSNNQRITCLDQNKKPIVTITGYEASNDNEMASAFYNTELKQREIRISSYVTDNHKPSVVEFIAYHECAHHQLDHVDMSDIPKPRFLWSDKAIQEEKDADCEAVQMYYNNHGQDALESLFDDLNSSHLLDMQRAERIQHCI